ncbi:hypothetical protein SLA2020_071810 [Shorea laevis]
MMIGRLIFQRRPLTSVRRYLYQCTPLAQSPPSPAVKPEPLSLGFSPFSTISFQRRNSSFNFNIPGAVDRCCFSSQAVADISTGGVVDVPLAQTGEGIAECELLKWFVREGDEVEEFQQLCEVQSDKATIEITSRYKGKVAQIFYVPGDIVKVGETLLKMVVQENQVPTMTSNNLAGISMRAEDSKMNKDSTGGGLSTPAVRNLAKQYGVSISEIQGSGKDGRVLKEDVLKYAVQKGIVKDASITTSSSVEEQFQGEESHPYLSAEAPGHYDDVKVPLRGFQRTMVKTMSMAAKVPHFHYVEEINCDSLVGLKTSFETNNTEPGVKYTFLPLLIKALSMALSKYPMINSCFNEESLEVVLKGSHNIGIAMATPYGLVVPNIKNVQSLSIFEITKELSRLQQLALDNKLSPVDISGGTISLSNIGAIGGKYGAPIINLPEVAIIAIGRIQKVPQFDDEGNVYPVSIMTVNIGADHRVLDGATVARFCNEWKQYIEKPELLMLHMK